MSPMPSNASEAIPYLNTFALNPVSLCDAMIDIFSNRPDMATVLVPTYARYLTSQEFQRLSSQFPAMNPLLNGYHQILGSLQAA
jgi:hypothetical protein